MRFLYTWYYYPLREPIPLSHHLGFYLDNPRTEQEIADASAFLVRMRDDDASYFPLITKSKDDVDKIEWYLFRFRDNFVESDKYVRKQFASYNREKVIEFIARMLVIARYPESESCQTLVKKYRRVREKELKEIVVLPGEYSEITNVDRLQDFGHLLSLLIHTSGDNYWGQSFLLRSRYKVMDDDPWFNFIILGGASPHFSNGHLDMMPDWQWLFLPSIRESITATCQTLAREGFKNGSGFGFILCSSDNVAALAVFVGNRYPRKPLRFFVLSDVSSPVIRHRVILSEMTR